VVEVARRALVLGGGGAVGNAWVIGVIAGLCESGVDVTVADVVIGTSSGATAAVQITSGAAPADLLAATMAPVPQRTGAPQAAVADMMERTAALIAAATDAADMRRRISAAALDGDAEALSARAAQWRNVVAARLPLQEWPARQLLITAVDARTGEPVVFDRDSGVDLADAVAASTSSGVAYSIGEDRYIDGGYRRNENADLAAGYDRVLVLSPFGGRSRHPEEWGLQLSAQVEELRAAGSRVETIGPEREAEGMFGVNAVDVSLRRPAAEAGAAQGRALAPSLTGFWNSDALLPLR
jgi:NTE family protein